MWYRRCFSYCLCTSIRLSSIWFHMESLFLLWPLPAHGYSYKLIKKFGRNCKLAKCDIEDAFRIVCVHPSDYHLFGFTWNHYFYYDRCLPMGASSSCHIFEKNYLALQWIMVNKYKAGDMSHIIDDFLFVGPANSSQCFHDLQNFLLLCQRLGCPHKRFKNCSTV